MIEYGTSERSDVTMCDDHHHHHVRLLEVDKRNQHRAVAQYNSLIVDQCIYNAE